MTEPESAMIEITSSAFAPRFANLLVATRQRSGLTHRAIIRASGGELTRRQLVAIEAAEWPLDERTVEIVSECYSADLGSILPTRLPVAVRSGTVTAGGVFVAFSPTDSTSLLTAYLTLVRQLRRQKKAPAIELRRADIDVLAEYLGQAGEVVVSRLGALMRASRTQRTAMAALFASGAVVIGLVSSVAGLDRQGTTGFAGAPVHGVHRSLSVDRSSEGDAEDSISESAADQGLGAPVVVSLTTSHTDDSSGPDARDHRTSNAPSGPADEPNSAPNPNGTADDNTPNILQQTGDDNAVSDEGSVADESTVGNDQLTAGDTTPADDSNAAADNANSADDTTPADDSTAADETAESNDQSTTADNSVADNNDTPADNPPADNAVTNDEQPATADTQADENTAADETTVSNDQQTTADSPVADNTNIPADNPPADNAVTNDEQPADDTTVSDNNTPVDNNTPADETTAADDNTTTNDETTPAGDNTADDETTANNDEQTADDNAVSDDQVADHNRPADTGKPDSNTTTDDQGKSKDAADKGKDGADKGKDERQTKAENAQRQKGKSTARPTVDRKDTRQTKTDNREKGKSTAKPKVDRKDTRQTKTDNREQGKGKGEANGKLDSKSVRSAKTVHGQG